MMLFLPIFLICAAGALAADAISDEAAACEARLQSLVEQSERTQREALEFGPIPRVPFDPAVPLPPTRPRESAAAADGGLFFDNNASTLTYFGNVRLRDARLHLRAANRLFLLFPADGKQKAEDEALGTQQEPKPTKESKAPNNSPTAGGERESVPPPAEEKIPLSVVAVNAAADLRGGRVALEGRGNGDPSLMISRGEGRMLLHRQGGKESAKVYADELGNVLMRGGKLEADWKDSVGECWHLVCNGEFALYRAAERELVFRGDTVVTTPHGTLHCSRLLRVFFTSAAAVSAQTSPIITDRKPFSQFEDMQLREVNYIVAEGEASLVVPSHRGRPASRVAGETLRYSVVSGECSVYGNNSTISFGENVLTTDDKIHLRSNGDIEVSGDKISGRYQRPVSEKSNQQMLVGSYRTTGPVTYTAVTQTIFLPKGLDARDDVASFHCAGECRVTLMPRADTGETRAKGQPNLAIARTDGFREVQAEGDVVMHCDASSSSPICDVHADFACLNLQVGTALFRSKPGRPVDARYGDYALAAQCSNAEVSCLQVLSNGDLLARGERVEASLPSEGETLHATCAEELRLRREIGVLLMARDARIETPDGIMTSRGTLEAELVAGNRVDEKKTVKQYPHLSYSFTGLHKIKTHKGGTLRTAQVSMQCEGDIIVEIDPNAKHGADRSNIRSALATDQVRLASKDASGRLMRADGDRLFLDPTTKNIILTGSTVRVQDEFNIHSASGPGARITVDPKNNMRISGARQTTHAVRIREQIKKNKEQ